MAALLSCHPPTRPPSRTHVACKPPLPCQQTRVLTSLPAVACNACRQDAIKKAGAAHAICSAQDMARDAHGAAPHPGRRTWPHCVTRLYKLDGCVGRGGRSLPRRSGGCGGAWKLSGAHKSAVRNSRKGAAPFHMRHIRADGGPDSSVKEKARQCGKEVRRVAAGGGSRPGARCAGGCGGSAATLQARAKPEKIRPGGRRRFKGPGRRRAIAACAAGFSRGRSTAGAGRAGAIGRAEPDFRRFRRRQPAAAMRHEVQGRKRRGARMRRRARP